jgi:hypothetical protein
MTLAGGEQRLWCTTKSTGKTPVVNAVPGIYRAQAFRPQADSTLAPIRPSVLRADDFSASFGVVETA